MLSSYKVGDIIMDTTGSKSMILARLGNLIARSSYYRYDEFSEWLTIEELEKGGWKVLLNGKEVLTKKEAEEILNVTIN